MTETKEVRGSLKHSWRELDNQEAIKKYHQDNARNIGMDGHTGDVITPEAFIDVIEAARATLDAEPGQWTMLAGHLETLLAGLAYDRDRWERTGHLTLFPYEDGFDAPHAMALSLLCAPTRHDEGNKMKKTRMRRRSNTPATSTRK